MIESLPAGAAEQIINIIASIGDAGFVAAEKLPALSDKIRELGQSGDVAITQLALFTASMVGVGKALDDAGVVDTQIINAAIAGLTSEAIAAASNEAIAAFAQVMASIGQAAEVAIETLPFAAEAIKGIGESGADLAEVAVFAASISSIGAALSVDPIEAYKQALEAANVTVFESAQKQQEAILEMVATFDGSAGSTQALADQVSKYQDAAVAAAEVIAQAQAAITESVKNTIAQIEFDVLTNEERYAALLAQAEEVKKAMASAIDPATIQSLFAEYEQLTLAAWNLLSEEEKRLQKELFIDAIQGRR